MKFKWNCKFVYDLVVVSLIYIWLSFENFFTA